MKNILKYIVCLAWIWLLHSSCNNNASQNKNTTDTLGRVKLFEKSIGESGFVVSVPAEYSITTSNGPDFSVYYISPIDTAIKGQLTCGLYFGNFPHEFEADNDSCKVETLKGQMLDSMQTWKVYNCHGDFSVQTITAGQKGEGWNFKVHAFGHAKRREDLKTILEIFSTLKKK